MRKVALLSFMLLSVSFLRATEIDRLQTINDVKNFIGRIDTSLLRGQVITPDSQKIAFDKADFDNNGLTDLMVKLIHCFVVMDFGAGGFKIYTIGNRVDNDYDIIKFISEKSSKPLIRRTSSSTNKLYPNADTIVFQYGGFMEYNPSPGQLKVSEINFNFLNPFGARPSFDLKITDKGLARYTIHYSELVESTAHVDSGALFKLFKTIEYINLESLPANDGARQSPVDLATYELEIRYNNSRTKKISDYAGDNTMGLEYIFAQLFNLIQTQKWLVE